MNITSYDNTKHRKQVIALWKNVFAYSDRRNSPENLIDKKLAYEKDLFFVACEDSRVIGTVMAGYDGHRGWIYSLAVTEEKREKKIGSQLVQHAEARLTELGCCKINLQVLPSNSHVTEFYEKLGYHVEERISMGKEIPENIPL